MQAQVAGYGSYGSMPPFNGYRMMDPEDGGVSLKPSAFAQPENRTPLTFIMLALVLPWLIFAVVFTMTSTSMNYSSAGIVQVVSYAMLAVVCVIGYAALQLWMRRTPGALQERCWHTFLFTTSLAAWLAARDLGIQNFQTNMVPYMDVINLNVYENVDPSTFRGQQLMDMGRVSFSLGSHLDLSKSIGFRNLDTFCVAPIVSANATSGTNQETYDFWAIGLNCCSGHVPDFHCGEFNVLGAHSAVRLLRDDQRAFFRLAVRQAEAAYNIAAQHPMFMYWMTDPLAEINAYADQAAKVLLTDLLASLVIQLFLVAGATLVISKLV